MKLAHVLTLSALSLAACGGDDASKKDAGSQPDASIGADAASPADASVALASNVLFIEGNDPASNAVYAFSRGTDGLLTAIAGSPFATGGAGIANPGQALGPDDSDQELALSADHHRLYAVNGGSDTIAVMDIAANGALTPVAGSPFPSGGKHPVSIGLAGDRLIVVNQGGSADADAGTAAIAGAYTTLAIAADGSLTKISEVAAGVSPSVALVTPDGTLAFGADFLAPLSTPATNPLRAFTVGSDGALTNAPGTPMAIPVVPGGMPPGTPAALGLALHPTQKLLYVGFVLRKQIGVYSYGTDGALTYLTNASVSGPAPCWVRSNSAGNKLYVTDTANNSVSVLDATTPTAPTEIQDLVLADQGALYDNGMGGMAPNSQTYQEELSPDGKFLYVVSQRTTPVASVTGGNFVHVLSVGTDGKVTELGDVAIPVPSTARPQGLVVL